MTEIAISTCLTVDDGEEEGYEPKIATQPLLESEESEQEEPSQHQKPSGSRKIVAKCKAASKAALAHKKQKSSKEQPIMEESKHEKNKNTDKTKKVSLVRSNQTYSKRKQAWKNSIKNFEKNHKLEFTGYLEFECVQNSKDIKTVCHACERLKCTCDASFTEVISKQIPIAFSFLVLGPNKQIIHEYSFAGKNAGDSNIYAQRISFWPAFYCQSPR